MRSDVIFYVVICLLLFHSISAKSQDGIIEKFESIKELKSDSLRIHQLRTFLNEIVNKDHSKITAEIYLELGEGHSNLGRDEEAIGFYKKAINHFDKDRPKEVELLNRGRYSLSKVFKRQYKMDEQEQLLNAIIQEGRKDFMTSTAHSIIGRNMAVNGDYDTALQYLNSVLTDNELMKDVKNELIIRLKITYIYSLKYESNFDADENSPDFENLKNHQFEIERKFEESSLNERFLYSMYNNIANVYEAFDGGLDAALDSYIKTANYYKKANDDYSSLFAISNMGIVYSKLNLHEKSKACFLEVINNSTDQNLVAGAYANMGYYINVESAAQRIPYYYRAFDVLLGTQNIDKKKISLPQLDEIISSTFEIDMLTYLIDLASIFVQSYKESNDKTHLYSAKESIHLIDQLVSRIRYESLSEESTLYWIEKGVDTYMLGVEVCHLLNLTDEAFYFMEKNKALLLQENLKILQSKWEMDIPSETLEREHILYYQKADLYERFLQDSDDTEIKESFAQINKDYRIFMDSMELQYPGYSKSKEQIQIISLDDAIKKNVSDEKIFVEYILHENDGYGIFCAPGEKTLFKISDVLSLQSQLSILKTYWTRPILNKIEISEFQNIAHSAFKSLFPFDGAFEKLSGKKIAIIADQKLNHIPFEALVVSTENELVDSYLINFCEVSYLQSISASEQIKLKENNPKYSLLGLVPHEFQLEGLSTLSKSKEAIELLSRFKNSKVLFEAEATKAYFLKVIGDFEIIHLNTHAGIDEKNLEPWIAFRDEKMGLNELYGKENNAEMVVLDACKTNDGKLVSGEGILNLSRGFFYNGAQSVLASHWNVNEKSGNEIIQGFYNQLQKGSTKSKALQMAKIDYLNKHQFSDVLPYYWAAYTVTGNTSPVRLERADNRLIYLGIIGSILLFGMLYFGLRSK